MLQKKQFENEIVLKVIVGRKRFVQLPFLKAIFNVIFLLFFVAIISFYFGVRTFPVGIKLTNI